MRVAYILTSLGVGGAERQVLWLASRMARAGHAVRLVILLPRGAEDLLSESASETDSPSLDVVYLGIQKNPWSALRGLALGRKSWLFAGSECGAERAALMYTLIQTAKLNNVDPQAWLADVLARIADTSQTQLAELLPWNWTSDRRSRAAA